MHIFCFWGVTVIPSHSKQNLSARNIVNQGALFLFNTTTKLSVNSYSFQQRKTKSPVAHIPGNQEVHTFYATMANRVWKRQTLNTWIKILMFKPNHSELPYSYHHYLHERKPQFWSMLSSTYISNSVSGNQKVAWTAWNMQDRHEIKWS